MVTATPPRACGICGRPLSRYNKNPFCNGHSPEEILAYNAQTKNTEKGNRDLRAFVGEFHKAGTVEDMFIEAAKPANEKKPRLMPTEIEQYHEGLRLVYIGSRAFHISMPSIFRLSSTSMNAKLVRDIVGHIMRNELNMSLEEVCSFFGYKDYPSAQLNLKRTKERLLDDEDMILAVDIVLREYRIQIKEEQD